MLRPCAPSGKRRRTAAAIDPLSLMGALGDVMPADTIYVDETITHSPMIRQHLPQTMPQSFFRGSGGLGQGIGTALGIKLAAPERPVVLLIGDGSFLYNPIVQALGASKRHDLPIIIVILNNKKYEAMRKGHVHHYPDGASASKELHFGVTIDGPDYEQLGSHFGFHGQRVEKLADLEGALQERARRHERRQDRDPQRACEPLRRSSARSTRHGSRWSRPSQSSPIAGSRP